MMNFKIALLRAFALFLFTLTATAQDGTNDVTFNPADNGDYNGVNEAIAATAVQPDGKILIGGIFTTYGSHGRNGVARLNADESLDTGFNIGTGANAMVYTLALQPDGKVIVGGDFTVFNNVPVNGVVRLNQNGSLDETFITGTDSGVSVNKVLLQPDGKIIVAGDFTTFNGQPKNRIVRLNADGSIDNSFNIGTGANYEINDLALQPDGKIIAAGGFSAYNGHVTSRVVRINANGNVDTTLIVGTMPVPVFAVALRADGKIYIGGPSYLGSGVRLLNQNGSIDTSFNLSSQANGVFTLELLVQPNGKILIGGILLARVNDDGSLDETFTVAETSLNIYSVSLLPDGKIIAGGNFLSYGASSKSYIVKLNPDGTQDPSFNYAVGRGANSGIFDAVILSDNKILIGGAFTRYNGEAANFMAKLTANGEIDPEFNPGTGINGAVADIALAPGGKILIWGGFTQYNGVAVPRLARIDTNGALDATFNSGIFTDSFNNQAAFSSMAVQQDGKILIGGNFVAYNGVEVPHLCRLNTDGSLDTSFNTDFMPWDNNQKVMKILVLEDGKILIATNNFSNQLQTTLFKVDSNGVPDSAFTPLSSTNLRDIYAVSVQADGKILAHGVYWVSSVPVKRFLRLNANGTVETTFADDIFENEGYEISSIFQQADGKILIAGYFTAFDGVERNNIVRINPDGTIDASFDPGAGAQGQPSGYVSNVIPQQDKLIIVGQFTSYDGNFRNRIARLNSSGVMATGQVAVADRGLMAYKANNEVNVISAKNIAAIQLYDISGKLLAESSQINGVNISIACGYKGIVVVKTTLQDGTSIVKKIY